MGQETTEDTADTIPPELRVGLIRLIEAGNLELPVLPDAANQVISASFDEDCRLGSLADIIGHDPFLTGHLLRVANSALYSPTVEIESLQQALSRLGLTRIREIAILVSCESRVFKVKGFDERVREMFRHSVATAAFAQEIARRVGGNQPEAFLAGLLHDVGKPVLLQTIVDLKARIGIKARQTLKVSNDAVEELAAEFHCQVGADLLSSWQLPVTLSEMIRYHHEPAAAADARVPASMIRIADDLAHFSCGAAGISEEILLDHPANDPVVVPSAEIAELIGKSDELLGLVSSIA